MPSIRKRIGYLPTQNAQKLITEIANNENLSQSKVVGILVEEALLARGLFDPEKHTLLNSEYCINNNINQANRNLIYDDIDELISDKGITYNKQEYRINKISSEKVLSETEDQHNTELFNQFKQFMLFQKMQKEQT